MNKIETQHPSLTDQNILTISEVNQAVKHLLEINIGKVWLKGEVSNLSRPSSGHLYFTLKDKKSQVRCALFRRSNSQLNFSIENGQNILAFASVSLYEARGDYQLIVSHAIEAGDGKLQLQFEKLKKKLTDEGLFEAALKKAIPSVPKSIGIITSPTGAAIRDVLSVLNRRYRLAPITIYPCQVQGKKAAPEIINAIETANQRDECDILILTRGGGSLEDLWCFNSEALARSIVKSRVPIITGIGHEIDHTIADFTADRRASTPSSAAEHVSPNQEEWQHHLLLQRSQIIQNITQHLHSKKDLLQNLKQRIRHPREQLHVYAQHLDQLEAQIKNGMDSSLNLKKTELKYLARQLNALSPLNTLERGYSIAYNSNNKVVRSCDSLKVNEKLTVKLKDGSIQTSIQKIEPSDINFISRKE